MVGCADRGLLVSPIRPENRDRYPPDWHTRIRPEILKRAGGWIRCDDWGAGGEPGGVPGCVDGRVPVNDGEALAPCPECGPPPAPRCECLGECGGDHAPFRCQALDGLEHPETGSRVVLTIAHLDHTPENCDPENLRAMCQACHLAYDAEHHAEQRYRNHMADLEAAGQGALELTEAEAFEELLDAENRDDGTFEL